MYAETSQRYTACCTGISAAGYIELCMDYAWDG